MPEVLTFSQLQTLNAPPERLLRTKLFAPRTRTDRVARPRLTSRLNEGLDHKVTLISAPAGFGKTTLLSEWCETTKRQAVSIAWVSLDKSDNDLTRFCTYLIAAIQSVQPALGQAALTLLQSAPAETVLTSLINDLATNDGDLALILDDAHVIEVQAIHDAIEFLLEHLPPSVHLIIASRTEPPLGLARLRACAEITELHAIDLRFTADEISEFFQRVMQIELGAADLDTLVTTTEGWAAGLQLAALSLRQQTDRNISLATLTGRNRYILDYLVEEVLQRQTEDVQTFLLQTSILDRLSASLCEAVTANSAPGQTMLELLDRCNLFVVPLDNTREWYRYHHLFADLLRDRLQQWQPELIPALHQRASNWFAAHDLPHEAIEHALRAQTFERAADLIGAEARTLLGRNLSATLCTWCAALPDRLLLARPALALKYAWALLNTSRRAEATDWLNRIEADLRPDAPAFLRGELLAVRAGLAIRANKYADAVEQLREAWTLVPEDAVMLRGVIALNLGVAHMLLGATDIAMRHFVEAAELSRTADNLRSAMTAYNNLGAMQALRGQLHAAAETYRRAIDYLEPRLGTDAAQRAITAMLHIGLAETLYEWNDLDAAWAEAQRAASADVLRVYDEQAQLASYMIQARIQYARGDFEAVRQIIESADEFADQCQGRWFMICELHALRARINLRQNNLDAVRRWADQAKLDPAATPDQLRASSMLYFSFVRLLILQAPLEAVDLLSRLLSAMETKSQIGGQIEALMLLARAHHNLGNTFSANAALIGALELAEPEGYVRLFLDEDSLPSLIADLRAVIQKQGNTRLLEYADRLLASTVIACERQLKNQTSEIENLVEPLSERELDILRYIAAGLSNQEIAQKMVVALSTIKWHINNLYAKLDARNRTHAVARARELGLL
ncbi:MAG: LuxR C-terminal-related transcriptional regulator [Anaerolineae bacterium]